MECLCCPYAIGAENKKRIKGTIESQGKQGKTYYPGLIKGNAMKNDISNKIISLEFSSFADNIIRILSQRERLFNMNKTIFKTPIGSIASVYTSRHNS